MQKQAKASEDCIVLLRKYKSIERSFDSVPQHSSSQVSTRLKINHEFSIFELMTLHEKQCGREFTLPYNVLRI